MARNRYVHTVGFNVRQYALPDRHFRSARQIIQAFSFWKLVLTRLLDGENLLRPKFFDGRIIGCSNDPFIAFRNAKVLLSQIRRDSEGGLGLGL